MSNLFSPFDPGALLSLPLNWLSSVLVLLLLPSTFWVAKNQSSQTLIFSLNSLWKEFIAVLNNLSVPGMLLLPVSLFVFIVLNNFLGLFPYIFTSSSHLVFTVSMALPLWAGHMVLAWFKCTSSMLSHLVPVGTPGPLMPLMVLIELVSSVIRPLTLSVRLAANMIAGHLLLTLLASLASPSNLSLVLILVSALILLCILECAVSLIQSYVFSILSSLYLNEVNTPEIP